MGLGRRPDRGDPRNDGPGWAVGRETGRIGADLVVHGAGAVRRDMCGFAVKHARWIFARSYVADSWRVVVESHLVTPVLLARLGVADPLELGIYLIGPVARTRNTEPVVVRGGHRGVPAWVWAREAARLVFRSYLELRHVAKWVLLGNI